MTNQTIPVPREVLELVLETMQAAWGCLDAGTPNTLRRTEEAIVQLHALLSAPSEPVAESHARDAITWTPETGYVFAAKSPTLPNVDVAYKELSAIESIQGRSGSSIKLRGILTELNDALNAETAYAPSEPKPVEETHCPHGVLIEDYCRDCDYEVLAQLKETP
jgi:hypothetical protein